MIDLRKTEPAPEPAIEAEPFYVQIEIPFYTRLINIAY